MNKKIIAIIIGIVGIAALTVAAFALIKNQTSNQPDSSESSTIVSNNQKEENKVHGKVLVAYYSAQNHTKAVAEKIAQNLDADTFEIVPQEVYTTEDLDWTADDSRVNREHNDESLRNVTLANTSVPGWEEYDTILIGYPIWWGTAAWPVNNFIKENNFSGKTVIPFCTSTSSGLEQSGELLEAMASGGDWQDGHRFSSSPSDDDIQSWTDNL